jgi:hypothetical protein
MTIIKNNTDEVTHLIKSPLSDAKIIQGIVEILSGEEWGADTLESIVELLRSEGYEIEDID